MSFSNFGNGKMGGAALVTGGAGFIGSHVCEALVAQGWSVDVLDNLSAGSADNIQPGTRFHVGDIRSKADLRDVFRVAQFDAVIHCAAQTSVHRSVIDPELDFDVNVVGTRRLLAIAKASAVRRFVYLSSGGAIYGETEAPATERTLPAPRSFYGYHKYAAEQVVRTDELPHAILRPSNVYGPRQRTDAEGGVVAIFLERLLAGRPMEIHGSGRQVRDFVHVSDMVSAVVTALVSERDAVWNVASGEAVTVLELAEAISLLTGQDAQLVYRPRREGDIDRSVLSAAALRATGRWGPPLPLDAGLRLTLADTARRLEGSLTLAVERA
jgi:UDP-glucose 4-epimerase